MKETLSIQGTANVLGISSTRTILRLISEGVLKEIYDGNCFVGVDKASILEYKEATPKTTDTGSNHADVTC